MFSPRAIWKRCMNFFQVYYETFCSSSKDWLGDDFINDLKVKQRMSIPKLIVSAFFLTVIFKNLATFFSPN